MNNMIAWWAKNTVAANLLMAGIIMAGIFSFTSMEREVNPTFQVNSVEINVSWPGAAPQEIEEQIVIRIEEAMNDLDNVDRIRSFASEGSGRVFINASPKADMTKFISNVQRRVDGISTFPSDIERIRVNERLTRDALIRLAVYGDVSEKDLTKAAQDIQDELILQPNVSIVEILGARNEEVSIELSDMSMRSYGINFDDVSQAIRASSINSSSGAVRTETGDVRLRSRSLADTQEDFEDIVIHQTEKGGAVKIGDVATVIDGFEDAEFQALYNGKPSIIVQVMTAETQNVVATSESVNEWLVEAQKTLPDGVEVEMWLDSSVIYTGQMEIISGAAISGLLLVFVVLIFTLRPKVALWVTFGIATAFAGAFIFLPANDVSLNMISLFAFLLVLGVIVDDAIVVGENIHTKTLTSGGGLKGAIEGTQEVAKPVFYAVLTTMVAFAPWLFLTGNGVQITRQISIIIIACLAFSLIEAFMILPAHLSKMKHREHMGKFSQFQKKIAQSIINFANNVYRPFVKKAVEKRYLTTSIFIFFFAFSVGLVQSGWVKFSFMPEIESPLIQFEVTMPDGTPYERSMEVFQQMKVAQDILIEEVDEEYGAAEGEHKIENIFNLVQSQQVLGLVTIGSFTKTEDNKKEISAKAVAERLRVLMGEVPDAEEIRLEYTLDDNDQRLQFSVSATEMESLQEAVESLKDQLRTYDNVVDVQDNIQSATDEIRLNLKPGAEKFGINLQAVSRQVRQAYFGEEVQRLPRDGNDVKVYVRYPRESRRNLQSLQDFRVRLNDGREVPLLAIADIEFAPGIQTIRRYEKQRSATVSVEIVGDDQKTIREDLEDNFFPQWEKNHPGVTSGLIGNAEGEARFLKEIGDLYSIALFVMYALIAIAFHSYWKPILIMTAIPFAYMGAVYGHLIFGAPLALFSFFGIGAAVGVVVNDNLVLVDYVNKMRDKGMNAIDGIVEAGVARFRPILLTSITTFVGLVPMMMESSIQAEFLKPTVISLAFGVLFAIFVTLALVPSLYCIGDDITQALGRFKAKRKGKTEVLQPGE